MRHARPQSRHVGTVTALLAAFVVLVSVQNVRVFGRFFSSSSFRPLSQIFPSLSVLLRGGLRALYTQFCTKNDVLSTATSSSVMFRTLLPENGQIFKVDLRVKNKLPLSCEIAYLIGIKNVDVNCEKHK